MTDPICDKLNKCAVSIDEDLQEVQQIAIGWAARQLQAAREHLTQLVAAYNKRIQELSVSTEMPEIRSEEPKTWKN